ncbi:hypothetical protein [Candidatus Avelusimicrobium gallicola]|nr:hypothetical protein [Elusimicrobium sp. An273]
MKLKFRDWLIRKAFGTRFVEAKMENENTPKEERIICLQIGSHLRNCPLMKNSGHCILDCGCDQLEGIKCNKGLPRTEAIERMAKALYDKYEVRCNSDDCPNEGPICEGCPIWEKYEKMAEAALDALLEVSINE